MAYALVTGASAGIGEALAERAARRGYDLVLVARREDRLNALAERLRGEHGREVRVLPEDLSAPEASARLYERARDLQVDLLVNNAGFGSNGPFLEQDPARELAMIAVNVSALVGLTRRFLPAMVERGQGRVLNVASTAGFQPGPLMATYYASKAFVISFSEAIAQELEGTGVTVTCHCPGATATEFAETSGNDKSRLFQKGRIAGPDAVADHAFEATMRGERLAVHGLLNKVGVFATRLTPRRLVTRLAGEVNAPP